MQQFTLNRDSETPDEIWLIEHPPVFTQGLNGKPQHLLTPSAIPVVQTDRGGQITFHGPGQVVAYTLFDLHRLGLNIRQLVSLLENAMIETLSHYGISAVARPEAPGVYINGKKIGSIGLRVKRNCSYHGLSLNNRMDLTPFENINPCGYPGLEMTQLANFGVDVSQQALSRQLVQAILKALPV